MFNGRPEINPPLFILPPAYLSFNIQGKCTWGGETLEQVLTEDPDGPVAYIAKRIKPLCWEYEWLVTSDQENAS